MWAGESPLAPALTATAALPDPGSGAHGTACSYDAVRPYSNVQAVTAFGGRVDKLIGDGIMAVFGAPVAHEDDPERAVRAALDILDTVAALNAEDTVRTEIRVRIGVADADEAGRLARLRAQSSGELVVPKRFFELSSRTEKTDAAVAKLITLLHGKRK